MRATHTKLPPWKYKKNIRVSRLMFDMTVVLNLQLHWVLEGPGLFYASMQPAEFAISMKAC